MNPLDIGVIAVIGLSAVFAFARGFVRELLSIVAWVGAGFITLYGSDYVNTIIEPMVRNPLLAKLIAWGGLFIASLVVLTIVTGIIARAVGSSSLSPLDRTLGFIFGLLRGAFILCLAYLVLDLVPVPDRPGWIKEAKSASYLQQGAEMLRTMLPDTWRKNSTAAEDVIKTVSPAIEAQKAMRALTNPTAAPSTAPAQPPAPTYKQSDQRELDRIINNQR